MKQDDEAERLIKLAEQRLSGLVITHKYITPAEALKLWAMRPASEWIDDQRNKPRKTVELVTVIINEKASD